MSNGRRMPFAEWLYRMTAAKLTHADRLVAIYAAVFDITKNDELVRTTGLAESTLLEAKRRLPKKGFLIVMPSRGGRGMGCSITPAYLSDPVTFTDLSPRDPQKIIMGTLLQNPTAEPPLSVAETPRPNPPFPAANPTAKGGVSSQNPTGVGGIIPRAPACIESSLREDISNINSSLPSGEGGELVPAREENSLPHMNGVGFVISAKHNLVIPLKTIEDWRLRFPAIDLEAKVERLAAHILAKGPFGCSAGWQHPAAWMVGLLADENAKAQARIGHKGPNGQRETDTERMRRQLREVNESTGGKFTR